MRAWGRRGDAVSARIQEHAIPPARISTFSKGKKALVTTSPRRYNLNRRVEFDWKHPSFLVLYDEDAIATQRIAEAIAKQIGPPFSSVENYIPRVGPGLNEPVPDWHWETQSPRTLEMIDAWAKKRFDAELKAKVLNSPMLAKREVQGYTIDPKSIVADWLEEIDESPTRFLWSIFLDPNDPKILILPGSFAVP